MGRKCFVPYCKSGYSTCRDSVTMFSCPNDTEYMKKWSEAVARLDRPLRSTDCICEKHFKEEDIIRYWKATDRNGKEVMKVAYKRIRLRDGAIPCHFPLNDNTYSRKRRKSANQSGAKTRRILAKASEGCLSSVVGPREFSDDERKYSGRRCGGGEALFVKGFDDSSDDLSRVAECSPGGQGMVVEYVDLLTKARLFEELWKDSQVVSLPSQSWAIFHLETYKERRMVITQMGLTDAGVPVPVKQPFQPENTDLVSTEVDYRSAGPINYKAASVDATKSPSSPLPATLTPCPLKTSLNSGRELDIGKVAITKEEEITAEEKLLSISTSSLL